MFSNQNVISFILFLFWINTNIEGETEEQYTQEYFVESKKNMLSKLSSLFISNFRAVDANEYETLFHKLELFPPLINFIDQNPVCILFISYFYSINLPLFSSLQIRGKEKPRRIILIKLFKMLIQNMT